MLNLKGFSTTQAQTLLKQYGLNTIEEEQKRSFFWVFIDQFNNFLTILLLIAAGLSFFVGQPIDGALIMGIVVLNAIFGIYQEKKANDAIASLKEMTISRVRVIRDGKEGELDSRYLVPGDIVFVEEGVKVPADGIVIEAINLDLNEATLTGESLSVGKQKDDELYMGTIVSRGRGYMEVQTTGMKTKFGQIAANLSEIEKQKTPLQKKLEELSKTIGILAMSLSIIVFVLAFLSGYGIFSGFLLAISLIVAVVPEGLPAVMTITLAIGVKEMAKKKAIMRKLSAIEALGSTTLIATDKTGTLTANKMKVKELYIEKSIYQYNALPSLLNAAFSKLVLNGVLCSTAALVYSHKANEQDVLGDPTEGALLYLANKVGIMPDKVRDQWQLLEENPFDSITKKMSVTMRRDREILTFTKGAFESILQLSNSILINSKTKHLTPEKIHELEEVAENWAKKGLRVLAFSYKNGFEEKKKNQSTQTFLGMVAIYDPPRPEVAEALVKAKHAGIKVVMMTGDNEKTAEAIATAIGLIEEGDEIITGKMLEDFSDKDLLKILPKVRIFARISPLHKARIVRLFQVLGEIVVVTGDGVNDAVALKQADVGVAMGIVGTDVARETADMIITDDNFATIIKAIEEGRNIIKNLKGAIKYLLGGNIAEALSLAVGLVLGLPQLFHPVQLLYTNLVTDGVPALALAFSPRDEHILQQPPETKMQLINSKDNLYIILIGLVGTVFVMASYFFYQFFYGSEVGRTAAFSVVVCMQGFIFIDMWLSHGTIRANYKKLYSPVFIITFVSLFLLQAGIVTINPVATIFRIVPVSWFLFIQFMIISSCIWLGIKGVKKFIGF